MKRAGKAALAAAAVAMAGSATAQAPKQVVTGPVATYWMSAQTTSGFTMGGMGAGAEGGGRPSMGSMFGAMMGGGGGPSWTHSLILQLGSARKPSAAPAAEHAPPPGLEAGPSLPLVTPTAGPPAQRTEEEPEMPRDYQKPRGRMLIYWGCGEHARPGQPLVLDFATLAEGKAPPAAFTNMMRGLAVTPMQPPSPTRNATYGEWPNARARTSVPPTGSLAGEHLIRGNYSPDIRFSFDGAQDFMPAVRVTTNAPVPSGAVQLGWAPVSGAVAYIASTMGGDGDTVVLWSSSEVQTLLFALPDYLKPADVTRLVAQRALLSPQTTSCTVPQEVAKAAPQSMFNLVAYGGEANFTHPPRPADPKVAWNIDWTVKVRYRSATGGLLGMTMPGMGDDDEDAPPPRAQQPRKPPSAGDILRGLGGFRPGG